MKPLRIVLYVVGGIALAALAFFAFRARADEPGRAGAGAGGDGRGQPDEPIDAVMARNEGKRLGQVSRADFARLAAYAASFDAPPPRGGFLGNVLVPVPSGFTFAVAITVREKAEERARDLPGFRNWTSMPTDYVLKRAEVRGQALGFFDRVAPAAKGLIGLGGAVAAPFTGGASLAATGIALK